MNDNQLALIAFGSNLGDSQGLLSQVIDSLQAVTGLSKVICSQPVVTKAIPWNSTKPGDAAKTPPAYLNAVIAAECRLPPHELMRELLQLEASLGRVRTHRWSSRTVDLDLLMLGQQLVDSPKLRLPHPRMTFRRFVLQPAAEVAPNMVHPLSRCTIADLLSHLDRRGNQVGLVVDPGMDPPVELDSILDSLPENWSAKKIFSEKDFQKKKTNLKLLVVLLSPQTDVPERWRQAIESISQKGEAQIDAPNRLLNQALTFRGPSLWVSTLDDLGSELRAALESTAPLE